MRPVVNLKALNEFIPFVHFKMEGMHTLRDVLKENDWMTKVDLKDAYFMIPIEEVDREMLRFSTQGRLFQFTCLPFSLSCAPWVFTKTLKPAMSLLRELGIRLVVYIDDILVMADSETQAREHSEALIFLLESLGFIVHPEKTMRIPTQEIEIEFLGMDILSQTMKLRIPTQKVKKLRAEAAALLRKVATPTAREVSCLLGKMNSVAQALPPRPLYCRILQRDLARALERGEQSYETPCPLSDLAKEELSWWAEHMQEWNGKSLIRREPDISIESDASQTGWGASCLGTRTGGPWSRKEKESHINCLELLAAFLKSRRSVHACLWMDNQTAVAYVNNMGGTVSTQATLIARELWMWCLQRDISLSAQYLPGKDNTIADQESREMKDRSDWLLNREVFRKILRHFPRLNVDLFASRLTYQLPRFFSWRPDPAVEATDAFQQNWKSLSGYANPPWNLVGRVLAMVENQQAEVVLVAPIWPSQPWYPKLLSLLWSIPLRISPQQELIQEIREGCLPDLSPPLAVWPISGNTTQTRAFLRKLPISSSPPGDRNPHSHMTHSARDGSAGVLNGVVIPFQDL